MMRQQWMTLMGKELQFSMHKEQDAKKHMGLGWRNSQGVGGVR